ncbi:hypothetical protein EK904_003094 [Melospiza melodia maxima]|nr:hypothetical protein EK904_003094 [Melospiza melodia maxima]
MQPGVLLPQSRSRHCSPGGSFGLWPWGQLLTMASVLGTAQPGAGLEQCPDCFSRLGDCVECLWEQQGTWLCPVLPALFPCWGPGRGCPAQQQGPGCPQSLQELDRQLCRLHRCSDVREAFHEAVSCWALRLEPALVGKALALQREQQLRFLGSSKH